MSGIRCGFPMVQDRIKWKKAGLIYIIADTGNFSESGVYRDGGGLARVEARKLAEELKEDGYSVDLDNSSKSVKAQFREAHQKGAKFVIVFKKADLDRGVVRIKNMISGKEREVTKNQLHKEIEKSVLESDRK